MKKNYSKFPPIIIPSSGRSDTALLDLTAAMNGENYVQVVVVSSEESEDYLKTWSSQIEIDFFVTKELQQGEKQTVGRSRFYCKKMAEAITEGTGIRFIFLQDDNVCSWQGITLGKS